MELLAAERAKQFPISFLFFLHQMKSLFIASKNLCFQLKYCTIWHELALSFHFNLTKHIATALNRSGLMSKKFFKKHKYFNFWDIREIVLKAWLFFELLAGNHFTRGALRLSKSEKLQAVCLALMSLHETALPKA